MMALIKYEDVKAGGSGISLVKLTGLKIIDMYGYLTSESGETTFKITEIVLEGDLLVGVEGEHDFPYLAPYRLAPVPNMDDDTLQQLEAEQNEDY